MQKRLLQIQLLPPEPHRPPQNPPQHIPAPLIARHRPVRQRKRQTPHMIGNHAKRNIVPQLRIRRFGHRIRRIRLRKRPPYFKFEISEILSKIGVNKSVP